MTIVVSALKRSGGKIGKNTTIGDGWDAILEGRKSRTWLVVIQLQSTKTKNWAKL